MKIRVPLFKMLTKGVPVFYNVNKVDDRSLSIILLQCYRLEIQKELVVCDLLAATGVRGLRCACEVQGLKRVIINDANPRAFELMKENVEMNKDKLLCEVEVRNEKANRMLWGMKEKFDYIDVDPYGSPNPFLDSSIRALRSEGLLGVASTDIACLCGVFPRTCIRKYGSMTYKTDYFRETGIRILAKKVIEVGAQYYLALRPIFAFSLGDTFRVYFTMSKGAKRTDELLDEFGFILHCPKCLRRVSTKLPKPTKCPRCGDEIRVIGPLFLGNLYSPQLCKAMLKKASGDVEGLLQIIVRESEVGQPWYYAIPALCRRLKMNVPGIEGLIIILSQKGYEASRTHFDSQGIKTNAPVEVVEKCISFLQAPDAR